jgi:hypothetical protein
MIKPGFEFDQGMLFGGRSRVDSEWSEGGDDE